MIRFIFVISKCHIEFKNVNMKIAAFEIQIYTQENKDVKIEAKMLGPERVKRSKSVFLNQKRLFLA